MNQAAAIMFIVMLIAALMAYIQFYVFPPSPRPLSPEDRCKYSGGNPLYEKIRVCAMVCHTRVVYVGCDFG